MSMFFHIMVLLGVITSALSANLLTYPTKPPVTATALATCTYNGHTYYAGQSFQPTPCEHCFCSGGRPMCAIADCFFSPCVDAVHDPTKCCPVCPNGQNCRHPDGTIIKKGDTYHPNAMTTCECPQNVFGFRGSEAICAMKMTLPTAVTIVDPVHVAVP